MTAEDQSIPPTQTFVVRLRLEYSLVAPQWRGRVVHLESGEAASFQDWEQLVAFLASQGQIRSSPPLPGGSEVDV